MQKGCQTQSEREERRRCGLSADAYTNVQWAGFPPRRLALLASSQYRSAASMKRSGERHRLESSSSRMSMNSLGSLS